VLLEEGRGGVPDLEGALPWYRRAAAQDHLEALVRLGFLYAIGDGTVSQDPVQAWAWFARAAAIGEPRASALRDRVGELLTEDERVEAQRRADALSIRHHLQE
jgi:TPR repeat protein